MNKKLPILYYKPGTIDDSYNEDWFELKTYSVLDLKNEITHLEGQELFYFVIEIISKGLVHIDVITEVLGSFERVSDSILHCSSPFNKNILYCTLGYTVNQNLRQVQSLNFHFRDKIAIFPNIDWDNENVERELSQNKLKVFVAYPLFGDGENRYTNQLLLAYNSIPTPHS